MHSYVRSNVSIGRLAEPALTLSVAALLIAVVNTPAFRYGLYGEYFEFVGFHYKSNGNLWQTIFTPSNNGFIRPLDSLLTLLSYQLLSLDPFMLHMRNLMLALVLCGLLYALLTRYTDSWYARVFPVLWFALAKVHFEGIGILNVFGTTLASIFILATLWMLDIYLTSPTPALYIAAITMGFCAIYSKESAVVIAPTAATLVFCKTNGSTGYRFWRAVKLVAPLAVGILALFTIKRILTGHALPIVWFYEPRLSWSLFSRNFIVFASALANLAFIEELRIGVGGIGWWLGQAGLVTQSQGQLLDIAQCIALAILLAVATIQKVERLAPGLFALMLMVASFCIYATIENLGLRYEYEFLLGATFLGGLLVDKAVVSMRACFVAVLLLFGVNGAISNYYSYGNWQYTADKASAALPKLLSIIRETEHQRFVFVTDEVEFWVFAVGASGSVFPMLPELSGRQDIRIQYTNYEGFWESGLDVPAGGTVIVDIDNGILIYPDDFRAPLIIKSIHPHGTAPGQAFSVQPSGESAISIIAENATPGTKIYWGGVQLQTSFGNSTLLTALVPLRLVGVPGRYEIHLSDGIRTSEPGYFDVTFP